MIAELSSEMKLANVLRQELAAITDSRVYESLRRNDAAAGKWLDEDPPLSVVQRMANNGSGNGNGRH